MCKQKFCTHSHIAKTRDIESQVRYRFYNPLGATLLGCQPVPDPPESLREQSPKSQLWNPRQIGLTCVLSRSQCCTRDWWKLWSSHQGSPTTNKPEGSSRWCHLAWARCKQNFSLEEIVCTRNADMLQEYAIRSFEILLCLILCTTRAAIVACLFFLITYLPMWLSVLSVNFRVCFCGT